jgi:hypothetical protein
VKCCLIMPINYEFMCVSEGFNLFDLSDIKMYLY